MNIAGRNIGKDYLPFVVAELSSNHGGIRSVAMNAIDAAKEAGCDAIKFQLYDPKVLAAQRGGGFCTVPGPWAAQPLSHLYTEAHTPRLWFPELFAVAEHVGIVAFTSVFHLADIEFLEGLGCPAYKVSSFDAARHDLIDALVATGKPVLVSNGLHDVDRADVSVMECVSKYPAQWTDYRIGVDMVSDHTRDSRLAIAAVATGAVLLEKHFDPLRGNREAPTPDSHFSVGIVGMQRYTADCMLAWTLRRRVRHVAPSADIVALDARQ